MNTKRRSFIKLLGLATTLSPMVGCAQPTKQAKYIFLFIGDGMGTAQRRIAERFHLLNSKSTTPLIMNNLPYRGFMTTDNSAGETTDSAASGTALATGTKTLNKVLCLADDKVTPLRSIAFDAKDAGMKVGIISSVSIDHATPASFYTQVPNRGMYYEISEDLTKSNFDYFAGEPMLGIGVKKDRTCPLELAASAGYQVVSTRAEFDTLKPANQKVLVQHEMGYAIDGKQEISLNDMTQKGIELLDNPNGFFMMVEGGRIDWSGHGNDLACNIKETLELNKAVESAYAFYQKYPEETLIITTADHETGGLMIDHKAPPTDLPQTINAQHISAGSLTHQFKEWKKSSRPESEVFTELTTAFGIESLSPKKEANLKDMIHQMMSLAKTDERSPALQKMYGSRNMALLTCLHELAARSGARWTSYNHTSTPVETQAIGLGAERFQGRHDNTDIGKNLRVLITSR